MRPCSPPKRSIIRCLQDEQQYSHGDSDERAMLTVGHRLRETELAVGVFVWGGNGGTSTAIALVPITEGAAKKRLLVFDRGGERHGEIKGDHARNRHAVRRNRQSGAHDG